MWSKQIVVLGGAGMVGDALLNQLSRQGYTTKVVLRRPDRHKHYLLYPNTQLVSISDYGSAHELQAIFQDDCVVINLVSDLTAGDECLEVKELVSVHQKIKKAAELAGVKRVLSLSQVGADPNKARNHWLCEMGSADAIMMTVANVHTTVVRSDLLLGANDQVTSCYRKQLLLTNFLPIIYGGSSFYPLSVDDLARAIVQLINDKSSIGKKIVVAGETPITLEDLAKKCALILGKEKVAIRNIAAGLANKLSFMPIFCSMSKLQLWTLEHGSQPAEKSFSSRFGFSPMSTDHALLACLTQHGFRDRYHGMRKQAQRDDTYAF
jgi:uncharacterized protein YbjT (DUF2867 family)